jgi:membrane fusion protein (multidrug efflux system)
MSSTDTTDKKSSLRKILLVAGPLLTAAVAGYFYFTSGRYVSTDNAFLKSDKVVISPEVAGPVSELLVAENQPVKKGDLLFRIGSGTYVAALQRAQAYLEKTRADLLTLQAAYKSKQAELVLARNNLAYAEKEYHRQTELAARGFTTQIQLDDRKHQLDVARQQQNILEQDLARVLASLDGNADAPIEQHPAFLAAQADIAQARISVERTELHAPFDGIASNVPKLGQHLNPGSPAMSVIANQGIWIEANFNETDMTRVRVGQPVAIRIDTYPKNRWQGKVESVSPATGSEFSILPPQNATGNWVKVIQRIPVRIHIEQTPSDPILRAGMSAQVEIDTQP